MFSLIIPRTINVRRTASWHPDGEGPDMSPGDTRVLVEQGELLSGILCKNSMGAKAEGIIHVIWEEAGPDAARKFLGGTQWLVNYWLLQHGFTIGIGDTIADDATMRKINDTIEASKQKVQEFINKWKDKKLEQMSGLSMKETFEKHVNQASCSSQPSSLTQGPQEGGWVAKDGRHPKEMQGTLWD